MTLSASNPFVKPFLKRLEHRYSRDYADMTNADWVSSNTTIRGKPFTYKRYPFQVDILNDLHPNLDVIKCSQVGLTEIQIRKALAFLCRNRGTRALFTLPNEKLMTKVSQTRIKPLVEKDSVFNMEQDKTAVRSKDIMQFGESFLYITGCTEGDATSTSADAIFNDEVDISPQDKLALFSSRLQDSDWKISQRFSTPSFPGFGIDLSFKSSDQRQYVARCSGCNHYNVPQFNRTFCHIPGLPDWVDKLSEIDETFADDLDLENAHVVCEKCHRPLDLGDASLRQWVETYTGRSKRARGYNVSPFCTDRLPISYIVGQLLDYKKRDYIRGFHNTVLGAPYTDGNIQLEVSDIEEAFTGQQSTPEISKDTPVWLGLDMGQTCHLTLGTGKARAIHVFHFEPIPIDNLLKRIGELLDEYNIVGGLVDRLPYTPTSEAIFALSKGKILPAEYSGLVEVNLIKDKFKVVTHAQLNRTMHLDDLAREFRQHTIKMSGYSHYKQTITEHLRDMWRDEKPEEPAKWVKISGQDHFFHSMAYLLGAAKVKQLAYVLSDADARVMTLVSQVPLKHEDYAIIGKHVDRDSLTPHTSRSIIRVH